jgi:acyl carrier protein
MLLNEQVFEVVSACIVELARQLPEEQRIEALRDTVLVGDGGRLDSLSLVSLFVSIEERLSEDLGLQFDLLDIVMAGESDHPLRTVGTLVNYLVLEASSGQ